MDPHSTSRIARHPEPHPSSSSTIFLHTIILPSTFFFFFFNDTATTEIYTLSLHDALPILGLKIMNYRASIIGASLKIKGTGTSGTRSEEHTSELQSQSNLVCRLLLEKKKKKDNRVICTYTHTRPVHTGSVMDNTVSWILTQLLA